MRAQNAFRAAHPGQPLPDALGDARTVAMQHARWQVARQDARLAHQELADAQRLGADDATVAALVEARDGALSRALAAQEELTGIWQERAATRAEHLALHGPQVLADQPDDVPAGPVRTDQWHPKTGRHKITGTRFDEGGYDRAGFHRATRRDALGFHVATGTQWGPDGRNADGQHYADLGLTSAQVTGADADGVLAGTVALAPAPKRTSAARAIADAKRAEKADKPQATVAKAAEVAEPTVALAPAVKRLALYREWNGPDELLAGEQVADVLGTDGEGVAALERTGQLSAAIDEDARGRWP
ncbi:hypothetical protein KIN34_14375 [Cellulomonas sp. DKR-3]|uniref:Uncharacterized protein n=1 Tax=Cellulomonas fulva TaxID=2835530 RepID=A0ABS5U246_9CELL|nr:hypothetical protein [Cellulomonas fulva]MBT0995469.1 hypothetical protein [Cellulomonas fulva]